MKLKAIKAYHYFWAVAIICFLLGIFNRLTSGDTTFDANVHDTYYVIDHLYAYGFFILFYFISGLIYFVCKNLRLNKKLTAIHTGITVGGFIAYYLLWGITTAMYNPENILDNSMEIFNTGITIIFLLVAAVQPLLPINLIIGIIKGKKQ